MSLGKRLLASIAVSLLVAVEALAALPQRTFVASHGIDNPSCSLPAPCRGFQAAIDAVAPGGEVVALDSAGYGAMEIHKSVSVVVPPGVHAGLSPSTGIPLPGYPGQFGVVLIDIQDTDVVVLRGLNINHQGTVTGGIEWISAHGGTVQIDNTVINGFPYEGIYMQAPSGRLIINDSVIRNSATGIFGGSAGPATFSTGIFADRVRIEHSANYGIRVLSGVQARLVNSTIALNDTAIYVQAVTSSASVFLDRCEVVSNELSLRLEGTSPAEAILDVARSTLLRILNGSLYVDGVRIGSTFIRSWGENVTVIDLPPPIPQR